MLVCIVCSSSQHVRYSIHGKSVHTIMHFVNHHQVLQSRKDVNYLYGVESSTYLDQILQLRRIYAGVHGQEFYFLFKNGHLLGTLMGLLQCFEHCRPNDEVKHHQEEDG